MREKEWSPDELRLPCKQTSPISAHPKSFLLILIPLVINFSLAIEVDIFYLNSMQIIKTFPADTEKHTGKTHKSHHREEWNFLHPVELQDVDHTSRDWRPASRLTCTPG